MISDVKHLKSRNGADLDLVEVTPDDKKSGIKITVMKNQYGISVAPMVRYFSKQKDTWIEQKEWFRSDQWNTMVALQGAVQSAIDMLGGDFEQPRKDVAAVIKATAGATDPDEDEDLIPF